MVSGNIPFIGATDSNNGITEFIANKNTLDKNVLGVNYNEVLFIIFTILTKLFFQMM